MKSICIDTNILLRFLLRDNQKLFKVAKSNFQKAENGSLHIYLDEVIIAEAIWVLTSYYKKPKQFLVDSLEKLVSQNWIINPRKNFILQALHLFRMHNISYIDCWIYIVCQSRSIELKTFDRKLAKLHNS